MRVQYEWDKETVDEYGDVQDHSFSPTLAPLIKRDGVLVLVRDETDNDGCGLERSWAYVKEGKLPEFFEDAYGRRLARVPKRFHKELEKCK